MPLRRYFYFFVVAVVCLCRVVLSPALFLFFSLAKAAKRLVFTRNFLPREAVLFCRFCYLSLSCRTFSRALLVLRRRERKR
jgi:hypothetical protein